MAAETVKAYLDFAWQYHLAPHFAVEEAVVFPILGEGHPMVQRAFADHRRLESLFAEKAAPPQLQYEINEVLEGHIRFEERMLFQQVQAVANAPQYADILRVHTELSPNEQSCPRWQDEFWK